MLLHFPQYFQYLLPTTIERMNNDITNLTTEDGTIPKTFPNINLLPTTAN
jgi:hypothetical protein